MPHVVLSGDVSKINFHTDLIPLQVESVNCHIKVQEIYVEQQEKRALLSVVVVEEGHPQSFYVLVCKSDTGFQLTIRLDPSTDPIKTRGVKRSIAVVTEALLERITSLRVLRHNLGRYLEQESIPTCSQKKPE